jgi:Glycosyl transferase family 2/Methyltransferase domain
MKRVARRLERYFVTIPRFEALQSAAAEAQRGVDATINAQIAELKAHLDASDRQIAELRVGLSAEIGELRGSLENAIRNIAASDQQMAELRSNLGITMQGITVTNLQANSAIARLEMNQRLGRQALHDLSIDRLSGRESVRSELSTIGVILPTCDRPNALQCALQSLAAQTRKPDKVIVVNDGLEDIGHVLNQFSDRLKLLSLKTTSPRSGSSVARNLGLDALDTSLVAFLDDDNLMWTHWIERGAAFLEGDLALDIVYGAQLRDEEMSTVEKTWFLVPFNIEVLKKSNYIDLNQVMHRLSSIRFDPTLRRLVDWDYILKMIGDQPERIVPVNAISSIYSASRSERITVVDWPPDFVEIAVRNRDGGSDLAPGHRACSCCGFVGEFIPGPRLRPNAQCPRCSSLERHRFLQLVGPLLREFWVPPTRPREKASMIEVAPSSATSPFRKMFGIATTIDADPNADGRTVDVVASLTNLPTPSETIDVALVLHVLEHIPDDRKAMSEIARVLRRTGVSVLQVPLSAHEVSDEEVLNSAEERLARYGQADHVRLYGKDFFARLGDAGLTSISVSPRQSMALESIAKYGLLADEALVFAVRSDSTRSRERLKTFESSLCKGNVAPQPASLTATLEPGAEAASL